MMKQKRWENPHVVAVQSLIISQLQAPGEVLTELLQELGLVVHPSTLCACVYEAADAAAKTVREAA